MNTDVMQGIEHAIQRMTALVRKGEARSAARSFGEDPDSGKLGWWVLACGASYDPDDFDQREAARLALLEELRALDVILPENIWVWDESMQAQLVITSLPSRDRAERVAAHLRAKGMTIRIKREDF